MPDEMLMPSLDKEKGMDFMWGIDSHFEQLLPSYKVQSEL